jgi:hypothetical protein
MAAVDIITDEDEGVFPGVDMELCHKLVKLGDAAVDVSYGKYFSHTEIFLV